MLSRDLLVIVDKKLVPDIVISSKQRCFPVLVFSMKKEMVQYQEVSP